ncbi:hypothetical protein COB64_02075 [Candidatus Wolfebacteria bacterium]|nr:MAG: hypothetical protein COB64_02075 [Candidatus Wolfebacteria bacterium]
MNLRPNKTFGQNFLKSQKVVMSMLNASNINENDIVLEIGPGKGILTEKLLTHAKKIIAIEKDTRLVEYLKEKFKKEIDKGTLTLLEGDILDFEPKSADLDKNPYKIVANIPYYITGAILKKFLETEHQPEIITILVQKEVARRIVGIEKRRKKAKPRPAGAVARSPERRFRESILSISVKAYGMPTYVEKVPARLFSPAPKVDSAILSVRKISRDFFDTINETDFFKVLKAGFSHKRKLLMSNIKPLFNETEKSSIQTDKKEILSACALPDNSRAENLTLNDWKCLTKGINS